MPSFERPAIGDTPRWATDAGASVTEPAEDKKDTGHVAATEAPAEEMNWLQRQTYRWLGWLAERTAQVGDFGVRFVGGVYGAAVDLVHPGVTGEGAGDQPGVLAEGDAAEGLVATSATGDSAIRADAGEDNDQALLAQNTHIFNTEARLGTFTGYGADCTGQVAAVHGVGAGPVGGGIGGSFTGGPANTIVGGPGVYGKGGDGSQSLTGGPGALLEGGGGTLATAPLRLVTGPPHTPENGDIWFDGAALKFHISDTTYTVATA